MRKECLFGLSSCVVLFIRWGCWRQMRGGKRSLSSVFDWLSLKSLWGAYLEMLVRLLVMGKLELEQGEEKKDTKSKESKLCSCAGRKPPVASFSKRIRMGGGTGGGTHL